VEVSERNDLKARLGPRNAVCCGKAHEMNTLAGTEGPQLRELGAYGRPAIRRTASASTERLNPLRRRSCRSQGVIPYPISGCVYGRDVNY
jgi:hypothetical protein